MDEINKFSKLKEKNHILNRLKEEVRRSSRYKNKLTLILINIDDYDTLKNNIEEKRINQIRIEFIEMVIKNIREVDLIGKLKEDQFLIICPNTGIMGAKLAAQRIRKITEFSTFGDSIKLTISAGIKEYIFEEANKLLKETQKRVDIAKNKGKNRVIAI